MRKSSAAAESGWRQWLFSTQWRCHGENVIVASASLHGNSDYQRKSESGVAISWQLESGNGLSQQWRGRKAKAISGGCHQSEEIS